ncbi:MAG: hypothetical protein LUD29_04880 [Clostridia bacterium]|nr:hypothetical protein [Clostridia bacterium]
MSKGKQTQNEIRQTPAPVAQQPAEPRKKADVIIEKVDCLLSTSNAIVSRVDKTASNTSFLSRQNSEIFERTLEENAALRQQIKYIAQQTQSMYDKMNDAISLLVKKIDDLQASVAHVGENTSFSVDDIADAVMKRLGNGELADAVMARLGNGELADAVASRIDYDAINDGVEEVFAEYFAAEEVEDTEEDAAAVSVNDTADSSDIARKVADMIRVSNAPVQEIVSADDIAAKVAEQLAFASSGIDTEELAESIAEKINSDRVNAPEAGTEINYEQLSNLIAQKIGIEINTEENIDYDRLAKLVADRVGPARVSETRVMDTSYETGPKSSAEDEYIDVDAIDAEDFNYELLSELITERLTSEENIGALAGKLAEKIDVEEEFDVEGVADIIADRLSGEKTPVTEVMSAPVTHTVSEETHSFYETLNYDRLAALVADKLSEHDDIVVDEFFDYEKLADILANRIEWPAAETSFQSAENSVSVEMDYDLLAGKIAALIPAQKTAEPVTVKETSFETARGYDEDAAQSIAADIDYELLSDLIAKRINVETPERANDMPVEVTVDVDLEELSDLISKKVKMETAEETYTESYAENSGAALNMDYERLSEMIAEKVAVPSPEVIIDSGEIAEKIVERMDIPDFTEIMDVTIDYEELAALLAERLIGEEYPNEEIVETATEAEDVDEEGAEREAVDETIEELDYEILTDVVETAVQEAIASLDIDYRQIAKSIVDYIDEIEESEFDGVENIPDEEDASEGEGNVDYARIGRIVQRGVTRGIDEVRKNDYEELSDVVAKKVVDAMDYTDGEDEEDLDFDFVDYGKVSDIVREVVTDILEKRAESDAPAEAVISEEKVDELSESIAKSVAEILPTGYDVTVDEEGCEKIARAVFERIDAGELAKKIVDALSGETIQGESVEIYDKIDTAKDEVVDRITAVMEGEHIEINADSLKIDINYDELSEKVAEKLTVESETVTEHFAGLDDASIERISDIVLEEVKKYLGEGGVIEKKVDVVDERAKEILGILESGVVMAEREVAGDEVRGPENTAPSDERPEEAEEEKDEEETSAPTAYFDEAEDEYVDDGELITISDLIGDMEIEDETEDVKIKEKEAKEKEPVEEVLIILDQTVPKVRQHAAKRDESQPITADFGTMMKYNRSFISRIIQGSDDIKTFYGRIKTAFLAYRKVNSNLSWGGERFNKGRETIGRLKIRGKTLVLYLALNPQEFKETVYHQVDASDIKSVANTPMMVKVKSPLGAKKAIRLIDNLLARRGGIKQNVRERDYVAMYPYETTEELIEEELIRTTGKDGKEE